MKTLVALYANPVQWLAPIGLVAAIGYVAWSAWWI